MHIGLLHFDKIQAYERVQMDVMRLGFFAHDLFMHLAARGHVDDHITLHLRAAGQTAARGQRLGGAIVLLHLGHRRQMVGAGDQAVLGKLALRDQDLAAAANAAPAAHRINIDAQRTSRLQK